MGAIALPFIVVAKLSVPIQSLIRHDAAWTPTELAGTDIAKCSTGAGLAARPTPGFDPPSSD
ncbi:MAG: hypothetical protein IPP19_09695 [Verrucomicrobia bacterium]|nr:hypothetical protein [Verrucomicrobiota bacterium]